MLLAVGFRGQLVCAVELLSEDRRTEREGGDWGREEKQGKRACERPHSLCTRVKHALAATCLAPRVPCSVVRALHDLQEPVP